jgi:hypothetical protein
MPTKKIDYTPYLVGAGILLFYPTIADIFTSAATSQNEKIEAKDKAKNTKKVKKEYKDKTGKVIGSKIITIDLKQIATVIYDAFYNNDLFGYSEDEDRAIAAINNVPKTEINQLKALYKTLFKKDLMEDFIRFLNAEDYAKVAAKFS